MKTLVLGLGNSILSDDAVGLRVAAEIKGRIDRQDVTVLQTELGGLNLLELLVGYDKAIVIDAIRTSTGIPGQIHQLSLKSNRGTRHTESTHHVNFPEAIKLARKIGMDLPRDIIIFAIEVEDITTFSEHCTQTVERAIPICVNKILRTLQTGSISV